MNEKETRIHLAGAQLAEEIDRNQIIDFKLFREVVHHPTPDGKDCEPCIELVYTFRVKVT